MTISELICRLQAIKCEHGDLPVTAMEDDMFYEIKDCFENFVDDDGWIVIPPEAKKSQRKVCLS